MTPSLSDLATTAANETPDESDSGSGSGSGDTDFERFDAAEYFGGSEHVNWAKQFPQTVVVGTASVLAFEPDFEKEDDGWTPVDTLDDGEVRVVLEDAELHQEDDYAGAVAVTGDGSGDVVRAYNPNDEGTEVDADGGRVIFGSNSIFTIDPDVGVQESIADLLEEADRESDELLLKYSGSAGRSVASTLDVKGKGGAHQIGAYQDEDVELHAGGMPEHSGHAIEYHPDDDGPRPRRAREFEIRPDVEGRRVAIAIDRLSRVSEDYDGNAYWASVFAAVDDDRREELTERYAADADDKEPEDFVTEIDGTEFVQLQPTADFEPTLGNVIDNGRIEWNRVDEDAITEAREAEGFE